MGGDLKYAVGGGIDDELARAQMLRAQFFDNRRTGSGLVADHLEAGFPLKGLDYLRRKAVRIGGKGLFQGKARNFPMAGGGILAGGVFVHQSVAAKGSLFFHVLIPRRGQQPQILQIGQVGMLRFQTHGQRYPHPCRRIFRRRPAQPAPSPSITENDNAFHLFHILPSMRVSSASCAIISPQVGFPRWASMVF